MNESIVVSSNCQTGGIAAALRAIFPTHAITPFPTPSSDDASASQALRQALEHATVWITGGRFELADQLPVKIVKVPNIYFDAFHPDLCYAQLKSTGEITRVHYNSRIAVWAYNNRIDIADAAKLYRRSTYRALGYFDYWASSVEALKTAFLECELVTSDFDRFIQRVKRGGVFMYSVNHPRPQPISELSKLLAGKLGVGGPWVDREIVIPDTLTEQVWPLYPEVGDELGLVGNYCWRLNNNEQDGVEKYLNFAYAQYAAQGIQPFDLLANHRIPNWEGILASEMERQ